MWEMLSGKRMHRGTFGYNMEPHVVEDDRAKLATNKLMEKAVLLSQLEEETIVRLLDSFCSSLVR